MRNLVVGLVLGLVLGWVVSADAEFGFDDHDQLRTLVRLAQANVDALNRINGTLWKLKEVEAAKLAAESK